MKKLIMYFEELEDTRDKRGLRHELTNIIVMSIYGVLCGNEDAESIAFFLKLKKEYFIKLLSLEYGTPSADTLLRVYSIIKPDKFMELFTTWITDIVKQKSEGSRKVVIPIDGKAVKSATDKVNGGNIPYVVSAFLSDLGISIGQVKVDEKTNEVTAIPELLELIDISGSIITIDAIGCQKAIVKKIVEKEGHYCIALKNNQKSLYYDVDEYFKFALSDKMEKQTLSKASMVEKGHGRIEKREAYVTTEIDFIEDKAKWENIAMIGMTRNYREINGELSIKDKYYILDIEVGAKELIEITRKHWSIENNLHWILDVHFREDWSTAKSGNSIHNLSLLRKICYNLVKLDTTHGKLSFKKKLMMYNHDLDNLKKLIFEIIPEEG